MTGHLLKLPTVSGGHEGSAFVNPHSVAFVSHLAPGRCTVGFGTGWGLCVPMAAEDAATAVLLACEAVPHSV